MSQHHRVGLYTLALCAFTPGAVSSPPWPRAPAEPQGLWRLMEVEVRDREWSSLTVHPCGQTHFMLFGPLYPGLRVKCQSGALEGPAQWSGGSRHEGGSTLPLESAMRNKEEGESKTEIERGGEFREWDLHCHGDRMERSWKASSCAFQKPGPPPCSAPKSSATMPVSAHK